MRVGVVGATGYAGTELLRLAASHSDLDVIVATGSSNTVKRVADHRRALAGAYPTLMVEASEGIFERDLAVVFVALPHGESQAFVPQLLALVAQVVGLGADFRLKNADDYPRWYGHEHQAKDLLASPVYGLVERHRDELRAATLIAVPGC